MRGGKFKLTYTEEELKRKEKFDLFRIAMRNIEMLVEKVRRDAKLFIFNFCYTLDQQDVINPIKLIPRKKYLEEIIDVWLKERLLLIVKSRQMMVTWLMVALHLWEAMYKQGRYIFFVSKKEQDADALIDRAKFVYDHLPDYLKVPMTRKYCFMKFDIINSVIQAVSQESDALRTHTASAIFSDEVAFQPYARESYQAMRPTIESGGKFTGVSSANGKNFFYNLAMDLE